MIINLDTNESPVGRMLSLIERRAPMFARGWAGGLSGEKPRSNRRITDHDRAKALELARSGRMAQWEIALAVGTTQATISKLLRKHGMSAAELRRKTVTTRPRGSIR